MSLTVKHVTSVIFFFFFRRFTRELAVKAKSVVAVDFMEKFIEKNRENNAEFSNIDFKCADVTKLSLDNSKWVFNYFCLK